MGIRLHAGNNIEKSRYTNKYAHLKNIANGLRQYALIARLLLTNWAMNILLHFASCPGLLWLFTVFSFRVQSQGLSRSNRIDVNNTGKIAKYVKAGKNNVDKWQKFIWTELEDKKEKGIFWWHPGIARFKLISFVSNRFTVQHVWLDFSGNRGLVCR